MHPKLELAERINQLYYLNKDDYDPDIHLLAAQYLVDQLGLEIERFFKLREFVSIQTSEGIMNDEYEVADQYRIRHWSKFQSGNNFGFYMKLNITPWKQDGFKDTPGEGLVISYKNKQVKLIAKYEEKQRRASIFDFNFTYTTYDDAWKIQV